MALRHLQFSGACYASIAGPPLGECELLQMAHKQSESRSPCEYWEKAHKLKGMSGGILGEQATLVN